MIPQFPGRTLAVAAGAGYLFGTFPTADLVAKRSSGGTVDLRSAGSGNPGSANAAAMLGPRAGATVMVGDIAKGVVACAVGAVAAGPAGAHLAGTASVVGHCYPVWTRFRGGKGVATSVGQCLATFPAYFPIDLAVAAATVSLPRVRQQAFVATTVSTVLWVAGSVVWWRRGWRNLWGPRPTVALPLSAVASGAVIIRRFAVAAAAGGAVEAKAAVV